MKVTFHWLQRTPGGGLFTTKKEVVEVQKGYEFVFGLCFALRVGETPIYSSKGGDWELRKPQDKLSDTIEYGLIDDRGTPSEKKQKTMEPSTPMGPSHQVDPPTPGKVLDSYDGDNLLEVAINAYGKTLSKMKIPGGLFAHPLKLEKFARRDLPFIGPDVDMRFTNGDYLPVTPVGHDLIANFAQDKKSVILFGKSGCGKTTAIFDAAQVYPCLLFTASSFDRDNERRADPGSKDLSFEALVQDVAQAIQKSSDDDKKNETDKLILALVLARLLMLLVFRERCAKDTAKHWLVYQLTEHMHHITLTLYNSLKQRSSDTLSALERDINLATDGDFYFYAFDEAQFGYSLLKKKQNIWKSTQSEKKLGIACPFLRRISRLRSKPVVVAGTAMTLGSVESCKSDLGKTQTCIEVTDFPHVPLVEIKHTLNDLLNLDGVDLDEVSGLWSLEGRGRLLGGLINIVASTLNKGDTRSKKEVLEAAIETHFESMKQGLLVRLIKSLRKRTQPDLFTRKRDLPKSFELLAISSLLGGTVALASEDFNVDLLHVGLCSVRKVGNKNMFMLDEELGRQAILALADNKEFFSSKFKEVCTLCRPAAGHAMEPLLAAELRYWCEQKENPTVQTFLEELFSKEEFTKLGKQWAEHAKFNIKGAFTKESFVSKGIQDDVDFVNKAVGDNQELRNLLLSPSTVKRPDFEAVMAGESLWFLSASSKLYSSTYDDSEENDLRSTAPQMFYKKKNGEENKNCKKLHQMWTALRKNNTSLFDKCLRIHFCIPDVKRKDGNQNRLFVDSDGSIVAYITYANAHKIFREKTFSILSGLRTNATTDHQRVPVRAPAPSLASSSSPNGPPDGLPDDSDSDY